MHWVWKFIGIIVLIGLLYVIGCILYARWTYFNPSTITLISENPNASNLPKKSFQAMIWNIGYCGLGAKSDFFYDGGKMMRPPQRDMEYYFNGVMNALKSDSSDFLLLQEVDSHSKRSYYLDQVSFLRAQSLETHPFSDFALNYKVNYIPQPWLEPMGKVNSGLLSLSRYEPYRVERHQLPGEFGFPKQLFFLRRCLLVQYYRVDSSRDFIVINVHNSAYDNTGELKSAEMSYLKNFLKKHIEKGDYVLCGGDWNQCPSDFQYNQLAKGKEGDYAQTNVEKTLVEGGRWYCDPHTPTNRKNNVAYNPDKTFVTLIDFFWLSDNVEVEECKGISNQFEYSDHQAVRIRFNLK